MADETPIEPFDRLHAGLAGKIGPLFQSSGGREDGLSGRQVGPYKLLQRIGSGGFGDVYMAEQQEPVCRRVALKVIKLGMDTRQVIARFEAERQALAMMDHPNIARIFDAAATETGRPYFVMELVKGEPITAYCDRENLSIAERLDVFLQVCHAVQHAHQKAVIHRDIKPSNVLVSTVDGRPLAKVIDFGIAKATDRRLTEKTLFTEFQQMVGTPEYMSPEQAGGSIDIDTRSDIYSLGVLLYELLTGTPPFDSLQLRSAAYGEMQRIIREVEPPKPSVRLSGLRPQRQMTGGRAHTRPAPATEPSRKDFRGSSIEDVAQRRRTDPPTLRRTIRGDLDWIVMKCLEKDRTRRYEAANDLAQDIRRHLGGEAVLAASPSAAYRLRKFVRRHRVAVGSGLAVLLALLAGLGVALSGLRAAVRARDAEEQAKIAAESARQDALLNEQMARNEAARSQATLDFVSDMFGAVDPVLAQGHDVTVAEVLDPAAEKVADAFAGQPDAEALVRGMLGQAYTNVARYPRAVRELERAWTLHGSAGRAVDEEALTVLHNYGVAVLQAGDVPRGRELLQQAYDQRLAALGGEHRHTLETRSMLALARQLAGDGPGAIADLRAVLIDQEQSLGKSDRNTLESQCSLADMLVSAGQFEEAVATAREAAQRAVAEFGADSPTALTARSIEAEALKTLGRFDEARERLEEVVASKTKLYGEGHPSTLVSLDVLAGTLAQLHQDEQALALARTVAARATQTLGERHPVTLTYLNNLAQALRRAGLLDEAEPIYRRVLALRGETGGERSQEALVVMSNLGLLLMQRGRAGEALPLLRDALDGFRRELPGNHWMLGVALVNLGRCETALQHFPEAEKSLTDAHALLSEGLGSGHGRTLAARAALAELYEAWEKPDQARIWRGSP
ncbi:MAG: Serine/threonine-protein kinase PknD [Phycisphaerae bacterium]|nr:Serine/threonine-protein kinase PknD [Phycisphaerae bacterium]